MDDGGGSGLGIVIYLAVLVFYVASMWKVFAKAGEPGWAAIIPIYNTWVLTKISGTGALWFVLLFIPFINIVAIFYVLIELAKSFGKGSGYGIGLALLGFIFFPMLGFGSSQYVGPGGSPQLPPTGGPHVA
jgi:hypothetical protein